MFWYVTCKENLWNPKYQHSLISLSWILSNSPCQISTTNLVLSPPPPPPAEKPKAPKAAPVIQELGTDFVDLSWSPPESDGGSPITGYQLERLDISGRSWLPVNKEPISDTSYRVKELREGVQYEFRVRALNALGMGEPSPSSEPFICGHSIGEGIGNYYYNYYCIDRRIYLNLFKSAQSAAGLKALKPEANRRYLSV